MIKTLVVLGTRPEAIKLAPLIMLLRQDSMFEVKVCITAQHRQMLDQVLELFDIQPDFDLDLMQADQDLTELSCRILQSLQPILQNEAPDVVIVHGDTTTTFVAALAAFYQQIPIVHIEAGLRSGELYAPFPEEANRLLVSQLSNFHFAPTEQARQNLLNEGKPPERIWVTGNTVIDALFAALRKIRKNPPLAEQLASRFPFLAEDKRLILITAHRRENFGQKFEQICQAISEIAMKYPDVQIVYPVHLNPNVREPVYRLLAHHPNIFLIEPQEYLPFIYLMDKSYLILTDSGGIQEEAPSLAKPVLLMREMSERPEGIEVGTVKVVGTDKQRIVAEIDRLLTDQRAYQAMAQAKNPYGDGQAAQRICVILRQLKDKVKKPS